MSQKNNIFKKISQYCKKTNLIQDNTTIIIGLSGGPDSVFLLHFLHAIKAEKQLSLVAAHLDHEWRSDSNRDVEFCKQLTQQLAIPLEIARYSDFSSHIKQSGSKEDCARQARRLFFTSLYKRHAADAVALAHHAQDQQETFFIRLLRGSSLTGLTGIRPKSGPYIRPLLPITKEEILTYLHDNSIAYLVDPTNQSNRFLRNRIRNTLIPTLQQCDDRFESTFSMTLHRLQETELFLEELTVQALQDTSTQQGDLVLDQFKKLHKTIGKRVLLAWLYQHNVPFTLTESFIKEITRFLAHAHGGTHQIHKQWAIKKRKGYASIIKNL